MTHEIDVWVRPTEENAARVVRALSEFGFSEPVLDSEMFIKPGKVVRMATVPE